MVAPACCAPALGGPANREAASTPAAPAIVEWKKRRRFTPFDFILRPSILSPSLLVFCSLRRRRTCAAGLMRCAAFPTPTPALRDLCPSSLIEDLRHRYCQFTVQRSTCAGSTRPGRCRLNPRPARRRRVTGTWPRMVGPLGSTAAPGLGFRRLRGLHRSASGRFARFDAFKQDVSGIYR